MTGKRLAEGLHIVPGLVNVYLLETEEGLALLDTGFPNSTKKILAAVRELGGTPRDVRNIILTHCHPDHIGSAAALKRETGATVWAHPVDAPRIEAGETFRDGMTASPGLRNRILTRVLSGQIRRVEPTKVDRLLEDGESPSFARDLTAIHSPGHCAGQIAFIWDRLGGVLFAADTCVNRGGLRLPVATEDARLARASLTRIAGFTFDKICVMHGRPILSGAGGVFRQSSFDR